MGGTIIVREGTERLVCASWPLRANRPWQGRDWARASLMFRLAAGHHHLRDGPDESEHQRGSGAIPCESHHVAIRSADLAAGPRSPSCARKFRPALHQHPARFDSQHLDAEACADDEPRLLLHACVRANRRAGGLACLGVWALGCLFISSFVCLFVHRVSTRGISKLIGSLWFARRWCFCKRPSLCSHHEKNTKSQQTH